MEQVWQAASWAARIGFLWFFIMSGVNHIRQLAGMTAYAQSKHVPAAKAMVVVTGLMMLVGSALILADWHPLWGCAMIALFVWAVAFWMHDFWNEQDPMARANQQAHFWKNLQLGFAAVLYAVAVHRGAI